jgi:hypothetical protein
VIALLKVLGALLAVAVAAGPVLLVCLFGGEG